MQHKVGFLAILSSAGCIKKQLKQTIALRVDELTPGTVTHTHTHTQRLQEPQMKLYIKH